MEKQDQNHDINDTEINEKTLKLCERLEALGLQENFHFKILSKIYTNDKYHFLVVKSLLWEYRLPGSNELLPILIALSENKKVEKKLLKTAILKRFNISLEKRKKLYFRLMKREKAENISGYKIGSIPFLGIATSNIPIFFDSDAFFEEEKEHFLVGGGAEECDLLLHRSRLQGEILEDLDIMITNISIFDDDIKDDSKYNTIVDAQNKERVMTEKELTMPSVNNIRKAAMKEDGFDKLKKHIYSIKKVCESEADGDTYQIIKNMINDVNETTSGKSALHCCAWRGSLESASLLLEYGADVNQSSIGEGNYGKTPIFYALTRCRETMVSFLLERVANLLIVNNKGQSPLSLAMTHVSRELQELMKTIEHEQNNSGVWINFRETNSDFKKYGDLDPRFGLDEDNGFTLDEIVEIKNDHEKIRRFPCINPTNMECVNII